MALMSLLRLVELSSAKGETACYIFLALSPAVGFSYVITWALFLARPGCVSRSPGFWNLPSDLPFLLAAEPAGVHAQG